MPVSSQSSQPSRRLIWPKDLPQSLDYPEVPVGAILAGSARRFPDRVALHYGGADLTYAQLWRRSCRFATALRQRGIGHGHVVVVHLPNCPQYAVAYYGTLLAGATFSPANPLLPPDELASQLDDSAAEAIVTLVDTVQVVTSVAGDHGGPVRLVLVTDRQQAADPTRHVVENIGHATKAPAGSHGDLVDFEAFLGEAAQVTGPPDLDIDVHRDVAHLAYTGGTTGRSKGVELPHRTVVVNSLQYACWIHGCVPVLDSEDDLTVEQSSDDDEWRVRVGAGAVIALTPWFHAMGTIGGLDVPVIAGATLVLHDRFDPGAYLADAERFQVTSISGAPPVFAALLAHPELDNRDLSAVRTISSGAAPLPHELISALERRFPEVVIVEGYGLTEVTMGATLNPAGRSALRKPGTVGLPVFDTEVAIVPAEGHGDPLPSGTPGEVCLRGPQVMSRYHDRPEETAGVLSDGWLRTGDIGTLDEDGYLSIVDRKKDMLIYKGYNVYPRELEELLHAQPAVASAAVVGRPDATVGELPVAFVVRTPGDNSATADEILVAVNERVVPYKRLRELHFVDEIPVSAAGKVLKRELRDQLATSVPET